ncbi:hypothetical protein [Parasphingorhabdus sp.]|uniref:hypothetical protein n=1 Tax=Parasphingorhabdus sp. TaxID=2709688 RepID=UPI0032EF2531
MAKARLEGYAWKTTFRIQKSAAQKRCQDQEYRLIFSPIQAVRIGQWNGFVKRISVASLVSVKLANSRAIRPDGQGERQQSAVSNRLDARGDIDLYRYDSRRRQCQPDGGGLDNPGSAGRAQRKGAPWQAWRNAGRSDSIFHFYFLLLRA